MSHMCRSGLEDIFSNPSIITEIHEQETRHGLDERGRLWRHHKVFYLSGEKRGTWPSDVRKTHRSECVQAPAFADFHQWQ